MKIKSATIEIEYPGSFISVNHYKYRGGIYTRKEAKDWMIQLGWMLKPYHIEDWRLPLTVRCSGVFRDKRSQPDLSNLSKIILDSIEDTIGINDKYMRWVDGDVSYGDEPRLIIEITENLRFALPFSPDFCFLSVFRNWHIVYPPNSIIAQLEVICHAHR